MLLSVRRLGLNLLRQSAIDTNRTLVLSDVLLLVGASVRIAVTYILGEAIPHVFILLVASWRSLAHALSAIVILGTVTALDLSFG